MRSALLPIAASLSVGCSSRGDCSPGGDGTYTTQFYDKLSDYCMVSIEDGEIVPKQDVMPYDQATPLFSDYALKRRTIWVPPGQSAGYRDDGPLDFPIGTVA